MYTRTLGGRAAQGGLQVRLEPLQLHAQAGVQRELAGGGKDAPRAEERGVQRGGAADGEARASPEAAAAARRRGAERRAQVRRDVRQPEGFGCT